NADGIVARDALRVINEINRVAGGRRLPNPTVGAENPVVQTAPGVFDYFYDDVNGDDFVTAVDALQVINYLNNPPPGGEEGEADQAAPSSGTQSVLPHSAVDGSFAVAGAWWGTDDAAAGTLGRKK
ncbi:MAG: hypothetical protein K8R36_01715, partial [Planctomycetales bacterium]|nr:hypothetical protein [Planctomycetales bacterium]